jgi:hypothetical protein
MKQPPAADPDPHPRSLARSKSLRCGHCGGQKESLPRTGGVAKKRGAPRRKGDWGNRVPPGERRRLLATAGGTGFPPDGRRQPPSRATRKPVPADRRRPLAPAGWHDDANHAARVCGAPYQCSGPRSGPNSAQIGVEIQYGSGVLFEGVGGCDHRYCCATPHIARADRVVHAAAPAESPLRAARPRTRCQLTPSSDDCRPGCIAAI